MLDKFKKIIMDLEESRSHHRAVKATIKELNKLTDRELQDIGIARGDIYSVVNGDTTLQRVRANG